MRSAPPLGAPDLVRNIAETATHAARQVLTRASVSPRDAFVAGLLEPARPVSELGISWPEIADRIAEQTGLTIVHGFRHRDRAAGGTGHPITPAADCLLFRNSEKPRLLIHLGAVTSLLFLPPNAKVSAAVGFEAGTGEPVTRRLRLPRHAWERTDRPRREEGRARALPRTAPGAVARTPAPDADAAQVGPPRGIWPQLPACRVRRGPATQRGAPRSALHRDASRGPRRSAMPRRSGCPPRQSAASAC